MCHSLYCTCQGIKVALGHELPQAIVPSAPEADKGAVDVCGGRGAGPNSASATYLGRNYKLSLVSLCDIMVCTDRAKRHRMVEEQSG